MPNPNENQPNQAATNSAQVNPAGNAAEQVKDAAKQEAKNVADAAQAQMANVGQQAQAQIQNLGQNATAQMQNLGQAGVSQVQNLGQAGVEKMGNLVGQMMKPTQENQPAVSKEEKVYATIAYIPFVAFISIIIKPDSAYVRLHAKQGLLLSILFFFIGLLAAVASLFGLIGQLLAFLLGLVPLGCIITAVYSMYLAASGFWWKIPVLSSIADLIPVEWMAKTSKENITGQIGVAKTDYDVRQETLQKEQAENTAPQKTTIPTEGNTAASMTGAAQTTQTPANNNAPTAGTGPSEGQQTK